MRLCEEIGMDKLGNPVVVDIQNVANFVESEGDERLWDLHEDIPSWLSPWPTTAYEWRSTTEASKTRMMVVMTTEQDKLNRMFDVRCLVIAVGPTLPEPGYEYVLSYRLNADGSANREMIKTNVCPNTKKEIERGSWNTDALLGFILPALMTNSFLACKNVNVHDVAPHPKLAKAQFKKRGVPKITYKILDIGPAKEVLRTEGGIEHNGLQKALHICRGHFATYGPDHPLFGKYTGTFWKPMHVRGSAKNGVVVKDYKLKTPAPA